MDSNTITGRLLAALAALPIIIFAGSRGESAQTTVTVYDWSVVTQPVEPLQWRADSDFLLGTAGQWNAGNDQGTSGPNPLRGIKASSQYVPDNDNSVPSEAYAVQTLDAGTVEMVSSDIVPFYYNGAADYVMLKNGGAVSGEWFQPPPSAASK